MNDKELRAVMALNGDKLKDLAPALGITASTLSQKLNGVVGFSRVEIETIALRYKLTPEELVKIFFAGMVS